MEPGYITLHVKDASGCWEPSYLVKTNIPVLWSEPGYIAFPLYVPVFLSYVPVFAATYIPVPSMEAGHIKFLSYVPVFKLYNPVFSTTGTYLPRLMIHFVVVKVTSIKYNRWNFHLLPEMSLYHHASCVLILKTVRLF